MENLKNHIVKKLLEEYAFRSVGRFVCSICRFYGTCTKYCPEEKVDGRQKANPLYKKYPAIKRHFEREKRVNSDEWIKKLDEMSKKSDRSILNKDKSIAKKK